MNTCHKRKGIRVLLVADQRDHPGPHEQHNPALHFCI